MSREDQLGYYDPTWTQKERLAFILGNLQSLELWAHWKDGVQYVGNCGTTLKEASNELWEEAHRVREKLETKEGAL